MQLYMLYKLCAACTRSMVFFDILVLKYTPKVKPHITYIAWDTRVLPLYCKGVAYFRRALSHKPTQASIMSQPKTF